MKIFAIVLAGLLLFINNANARVFSFIYIEAGEGNSSGGHVAVQFSDEVYHYQYENTFIRLFKQNAENFRNHYQLKQNRNLHIADIEVSDATYERLSSHFKVRLFKQKHRLRYFHALQQNQALLLALLKLKTAKQLTRQDAPNLTLGLPGAGLFYKDESFDPKTNTTAECNTTNSSAKVISEVRRQIEIRYGKNYLPQRIDAYRSQINWLSPLNLTNDNYSFSEQYSDLLNGLLALQVLQNYQPLVGDACFQVNLPEMQLSEPELQQIKKYQEYLWRSVLSLIKSNRPDWSHAFFVTLGRLITIEQTIQTRHWTFLDDTSETTSAVPNDQVKLYAKHMQQERLDDLKSFQRALTDLRKFSTAYAQNYVAAEMLANRNHQWQLFEKAQFLRYRSEQAVPEKNISANRFLMSSLPVELLHIALSHHEKVNKRLFAEDAAKNGYHLLTNNCVSAMFEIISDAVSGQSEQMLGGYIDPKFNFIPFQAFDSVKNTYKVVKTKKLSAYRERKLAEMYGREYDGFAYLRESNIFSSSLYNYNPDDSWFVFFTDDAIFLRPLFGSVNILASVSQSIFGLLTFPFNGGKELKTGARGVLASLPELAFFNIRKGSYPYALH